MLNKIMLIGNLGRDPEMSYTQSGKAVTKFTMAVNRRRKNRETGAQEEETQWFNIVAWTTVVVMIVLTLAMVITQR